MDDVVFTGSGVQSLAVSRLRGPFSQAINWQFSGEAVPVEIPGRNTVFVTMASPLRNGTYTRSVHESYARLIYRACDIAQTTKNMSLNERVRMIGLLSGTCSLSKENMPLMVTFDDDNSPETVRRVFLDNLEDTLGPGVSFLGASITITNEPVSDHLREKLNWLNNSCETRLSKRIRAEEATPLSRVLDFCDFRKAF